MVLEKSSSFLACSKPFESELYVGLNFLLPGVFIMKRVSPRVVVAFANGVAFLPQGTRPRHEVRRTVSIGGAIDQRLKSTRRTLCVALMILLFVSATPSAPQTIVALSRERQESIASWLRSHQFQAKLHQSLQYGYGRYSSWTSFINKETPAIPRSSVMRGHSSRSAAAEPLVAPPLVLNAPTNVAVTIPTSNSGIDLSWTAPVGSVAHYRVERSQSPNGPFVVIENAPATNHEDTTVSAGTAYLYRVRAVDGAGMPSPPSPMVLGTAITFTDVTLYAGTTEIKKQHIYDLRQSVNAVRTLAGVGTFAWTHPDLTGLQVQALHVQQLRDKLDQALGALNITPTSYEDHTLATGANGTYIKKKHIEQLRERSTFGTSTSSGPAFSDGDISIARLDPMNRTGGGGEDPLSRNFNWSVPLVGLAGRSGLDLGLSLSHNSLVWTKSGSFISFDDDQGFPSPGFRLGFPVIQSSYFNSEVGKNAFLLITSNGERVELRQVATSALYEAADSSHLLLDASTSPMILRSTDGTQLNYDWKGSDFQCTQIKDRNGNFITINYTPFGRIDTVVDTLSRTIKFNYDGTNTLTSISQTWTVNGAPQTRTWASFNYNNTLPIQTNFSVGVTNVGPQNGSTLKVLTQVTFGDSSRFDFDYTSWGQVWKVSNSATDGHLLSYRSYNLRGSPLLPTGTEDDCPRFTERRDWAKNWNRNESGVEQEAITQFAVPASTSWTVPNAPGQSGMRAQVTLRDGTYHKIYYHGTAGTSSGWHRGLSSMVETFDSGNALQRRSVATWTQDIEDSYPINPRVAETNVYDGSGSNRRRVTTGYTNDPLPNGSSCRLPNDIREYAADGTAVLRRTETDYRMHPTADADYLNRHIIGLVKEQRLYGVNAGVDTLMSQVAFAYDETAIQGIVTPVKHDNMNYSASFLVGRANLTSVKRYDTFNTALFVTTSSKYNRAGSVVETTDAASHAVTISYTDAFAANGTTLDPALGFLTLAYPTTVTDADGYSSSVRYNYDFGASTWKQTPQPNTTANTPGPQQKTTYDSLGRTEQVTNLVNNAYTRFIYGPNYVRTFGTVNNVADEAQSLQVFDGAGRVIAKASNHPGSTGGFSGQLVHYDAMGRAIKQSNPTETSISISGTPINPYGWQATGDDAPPAGNGWVYTLQSYDWKGRPRITTNTDGTTKEATYNGCSCAGGEEVTLTDEGTIDGGVAKRRKQKIYSDVLGRTVKTETLNWEGPSVYSTMVNTYNARDQLTLVRQFQGPDTSAVFQDTTMGYDGHGRLQSKHVPEQNVGTATIYAYNPDDTVLSVTDARGASTTHGYNNRHLATSITYTAPGGITIPLPASFGYDAAGNRISMADGTGSTSYEYDQLSRMSSETHSLTGLGPNTISYQYNLANQLTSITNPLNATINYDHDQAGRLLEVTGSNFGGISYASNVQYRAWGAVKHTEYGNGRTLEATYNSRLQATTFQVPGLISKTYDYYADNRLRFSSDLVNHKFDRFYSYDHANRIKEAFSGAEARFEAATDDRPYRQTYAYDAMGHLTERTFKRWDTNMSSSDSYTNNRHHPVGALWQYDADGNLLGMPATSYTYDAAGRIDTVWAGSASTLSLDGDGQQVKTVEVTYDPETETDVTTTKYYVRSTVLGGQVVTEIEPANAYSRSFVYVGGDVLAWLESWSGSEFVWWEHRDPSNASYRTAAVSNPGEPLQAELDPLGANAGLTNGYVESIPDQGSLAPYPTAVSGTDIGRAYSWDGIPMPVDQFMETINHLFHGRFGIAQALARSSSRIVGSRTTGVSWGHRFTETRGMDGRLLSRQMRFDPDVVSVSFSTTSAIFASGSLSDLPESAPQKTIISEYERCRNSTFGAGATDYAGKSIPTSAQTGRIFLAGRADPTDSAMITALWAHESNFEDNPGGDAGPAQLTTWWRTNHPELIQGNAYGTWNGRTSKPFDGNVQDNIETLGNIVRFSRDRYGNLPDIPYHYGPGDSKEMELRQKQGKKGYGPSSKRLRRQYRDEVMSRYGKYKDFFDCLPHR
jgi:YD repeat-containing protein